MTCRSHDNGAGNRVRQMRTAQGLSQEQLAAATGLSRTEISAIENARLTPSVAVALRLARALGASAEALFAPEEKTGQLRWVGGTPETPCRVWLSRSISGALTALPVERTHMGTLPHDAQWDGTTLHVRDGVTPEKTLVMAGCDSAVGMLANSLAERGIRVIPLIRSSRRALSMLRAGFAHAAGFHLGDDASHADNGAVARALLGTGYRLTRMVRWQEGLALADGIDARTTSEALRRELRWVGREAGSGAQACLDRLLAEHGTQNPVPCKTAASHYEVAQSVAMGWAEAGLCTQLVAEEARLQFLPARRADYDLCWPVALDDDLRLRALFEAVCSRRVRELYGSLPGYETGRTGDTAVLETA